MDINKHTHTHTHTHKVEKPSGNTTPPSLPTDIRCKFRSSLSVQWIEKSTSLGGFFTLHVCRAVCVGWSEKKTKNKKKHSTQNPSCTMPSHHCLELPCGSVPASPLLQLFWLQSRPRHSLLSPLTRSKQTDNDQVSRVSTFSRLCLRCSHPPPP